MRKLFTAAAICLAVLFTACDQPTGSGGGGSGNGNSDGDIQAQLIVNNPTRFTFELRNDPAGNTLGVIPPYSTNIMINMQLGDFSIFPVATFFDVVTQEMVTIIPTDSWGMPLFYLFSFTESELSQTLDLSHLANLSTN